MGSQKLGVADISILGAPAILFRAVRLEAQAGIEDDSWISLEPTPTPHHGMGVAAWERTLYVPGGATQQGFGAVSTHETYTLAPR